ncbi:MAG: polysaccharide ABC transporter ATP-binding protein [Verrucomicrobia bacterium]|nr:polysaccharide ABC transporter ATP-binding protein [Verrucomicrobiota bacterium]
MSDVIISVENLGKKYVLSHQGGDRGGYSRFSERLEEWIKKHFRTLAGVGRKKMEDREPPLSSNSYLPSTPAREEFWALKDVSFEVKRGEVVGIIGRNGAGKSTLLKILSRITEPTEGRVTLRGRVASLLEVGTGFHPELTGRENIFLNGAILGMTKVEIKKKFDEIVAFAEVDRFLDTPVKRYSSGMYVRLAFAVAAHLEPEILVVDEVLAVGDAEFQKKCLGKMQDVATGGRTVLFVSHNMHAVRRLCSTGIFLQEGRLIEQGGIESIVRLYENSFRQLTKRNATEDLFRSPQIVLRNVEIRHPTTQMPVARAGEPLEIILNLTVLQPCTLQAAAATIYDTAGTKLINADSLRKGEPIRLTKTGPATIRFSILRFPLQEGLYELGLYAVDNTGITHMLLRNVYQLEVLESPEHAQELKPQSDGCVRCDFNLETSS